ncbi:MAG TPA: hypothetical protein PK339_12000 [Flavitalea sp.]|nr:hypothetical protein [Flavitalea sp.]
MQLSEVLDKNLARQFIEVNVLINRNDPNYVRPLDKDIHAVFDKNSNKALRHAEITRWVLKDDQDRLIGRIAAFVNKKYKNKGDDAPVGGIGFFDCINDQQAADLLFDVAKHWLMTRGMEGMDGPINCGERDRWWGLLVEGFEPPPYCTNYNPPYYRELFENYGFRVFFNQFCYALKVHDRLDEKFYRRHDKLAADPHFSARHVKKSRLEKFASDFTLVYNKAWAGHGGMKQLNKDIVLKMLGQMKPVMDERINWFTYYNDEPIAMWINLPDLNQWFKRLNGQFNWLAKLKFLWIKATVPCSKFVGLAFGVAPEWQGKGVDAYMILEAAKLIQDKQLYSDYEMQWIGEFNPLMMNIAEGLGTRRTRKLITYRYLFDPTKTVKPHPVLLFSKEKKETTDL